MSGAGVRIVETEAERGDAFAVRYDVFVDEQGVAEELEYDEHDDDPETVHFVAYDGEPVGAARMRPIEGGAGKVERVAVLEAARGGGWGRRLMAALESAARDAGLRSLVLHAQTSAEGFYRTLGYETTSGVFEEAGISHVTMRKPLEASDAAAPNR
ncbi:GNAT family N-acetyltransferase [Haloferacaceae archaeon DSL9]